MKCGQERRRKAPSDTSSKFELTTDVRRFYRDATDPRNLFGLLRPHASFRHGMTVAGTSALSPPDQVEAFECMNCCSNPRGARFQATRKGMREHLTVLDRAIRIAASHDVVDVPEGATAR
jgi:hypothetical protein